jgi:hypothetical protein
LNTTAGETCDDSGESPTCDNDCTANLCGDGLRNATAGEACDDSGESATCNTDCTTSVCGDGTTNTTAGETCDESGESATCDSDCTSVTCGDGTTNATAGEACDDSGESASCDVNCTTASCGDGMTNTTAGEACDDSGESASCDTDCTAVTCGDGTANTTAGETCDDSGESATCNVNCTTALCGDGMTNSTAGEACDDSGESATCNTDCSAASCGDDILNVSAGEECEPGVDSYCAGDCTFTYAHYMVNRYSFSGSGTTLTDSVSGANGTAVGTTLTGTGTFTMGGAASGDYGNLPNRLISVHTNLTIETWVTWNGVNYWERVFDFGVSDAGEGLRGQGVGYLLLLPSGTDGIWTGMRLTINGGTGPGTGVNVEWNQSLPVGIKTHVAAVVDDDNNVLRLYVNGAQVGSSPMTLSLSSVNDVNNWLGLSQFSTDPEFGGSMDEFRIYNVALSAQDLADSYAAGPDI